MRTHAILIGTTAFLAVAVASVALVIDPDPIDAEASVLIALGSMTTALTALSGLLLARAPWGRWGLAAIVVLALALASVSRSILTWVALGLGLLSLIGLLGPWLRLWTRHRPAAEAPGPVPVALMSVAPTAPLVVGLTAAEGANWAHWLLVIVASGSSILYGQGASAGLWGLRFGTPLFGIVAVSETSLWGAVALSAAVVTVTVLAWLPAATRTTTIITPPLPTPVPRRPR